MPILTLDKATKQYGSHVAVDAVSLSVEEGESFGLVGESGSGKTTLAKMIVRLLQPTSGTIALHASALSAQMIFQDPFSSLNPRMTVEEIISEGPFVQGKLFSRAQAGRLLDLVGLLPTHLSRYPHEFSGGQRQRIGIARALSVDPKLIVLDEPVSALDVSIRAQILNLLQDLKKELQLTYFLISHDLLVVRYLADRIGVMQKGKLVEIHTTEALFEKPEHPYTKQLLASLACLA